jgi:hypothetical protein
MRIANAPALPLSPPRKIQRSDATRIEKSFVSCKSEKKMIGQVNVYYMGVWSNFWSTLQA